MNHLYTIAHKRRLEARNDFDVGVILSMKRDIHIHRHVMELGLKINVTLTKVTRGLENRVGYRRF